MEQAKSRLSRRNVMIGLAGGAACAVALAPQISPGVARTARGALRGMPLLSGFVSLDHAGIEEWTELVGADFRAEGGYGLRLAGVRPLNSGGARPWNLARDRAFLAVFDVQGGLTMAGDLIYTLSHAARGRVPVLLSASADPATPGRMLAVFN